MKKAATPVTAVQLRAQSSVQPEPSEPEPEPVKSAGAAQGAPPCKYPAVAPEKLTAALPKTFRLNRNSVLKKYLLKHGWSEAAPDARAQFAQWDPLEVGGANADVDSWPRAATNCIDNIWSHYQRIFDLGLSKDFPETFFDWRALDQATIESSPIWFLKGVWGVHGKGITLIADWDDYQTKVKEVPKKTTWLKGPDGGREDIRDSCYLQRGVCNVHLYEQRKYILRVSFASMGDGRVFVYDDALGYAHVVPFDVTDKSWACHVSHVNVPPVSGRSIRFIMPCAIGRDGPAGILIRHRRCCTTSLRLFLLAVAAGARQGWETGCTRRWCVEGRASILHVAQGLRCRFASQPNTYRVPAAATREPPGCHFPNGELWFLCAPPVCRGRYDHGKHCRALAQTRDHLFGDS
jgi:hypothetical protein